ncbi:hypothetical protein B0H19DRAFT_1256798 [Mycena capillaripes]|nr:hypothetical protein B0H19DRAFT_1256798 [Mycena capillaripes]
MFLVSSVLRRLRSAAPPGGQGRPRAAQPLPLFASACILSILLAELPTAENAEGPAHDFFLSYPYLLVWTNQVDVWRFSDSSDLTHITTLDVYVTKPFGVTPIIDHARGLLILPEPISSLEGCKSMLLVCHLAVDDSILVLCTREDAGPAIITRTSVLNTSSLTVGWTAKPILGRVMTMHSIPSLKFFVLSAGQDVTNHDDDRESLQIRTAIFVLDARMGDRLAIHAVDSDVQGSYIVDCFVSPDSDNPVQVHCGRLRESEWARTLALFPVELTAASLGPKEIVAVAGVKKHPVISEGGREEDIPDWEEEEGKVVFAKW